ncbi:MAG TPA: OmpH family outer membrane protein [Gemmatimonadales bacterium]|nr:OmpH family outer membrane protein [Gemmatimonadales bacterium]
MKRVAVVCFALAGGALVLVRALGLEAQGAPQAPPRLAWVNSEQILRQTPGYAAAESTFNSELRSSQEELQKLQQQLDSAVQAFEQQSIALSPTVRQSRQRELQAMQQRFQQRAQELEQKARQRERELLQPIQSRVTSIIQGLRAEGNYAFIFDLDAPNVGIVAADPALNLTSRVLERLRQAP